MNFTIINCIVGVFIGILLWKLREKSREIQKLRENLKNTVELLKDATNGYKQLYDFTENLVENIKQAQISNEIEDFNFKNKGK